jgi:4'-phosphopantetheinyl transferase
MRSSIHPERLARIDSLHRPSRQKESLAAQFLLEKMMLEEGIDPRSVHYAYNENGKPLWDLPGIHFSLSHSGDYAAAVLSSTQVGTDIQIHRSVSPGVVRRVCTQKETDWLNASPEHRFSDLFACKEAWIKCMGFGLACMKKTEVIFAGNETFFIDENVNLFIPEKPSGYSAAVCALKNR